MQKLVYSFNEGSKDMGTLLGGKGANLAEMTKIGLRVPFGFIVTTDACKAYHADGGELSEELKTEIAYQMEVLENVAGKKFGDRENPLLVSVRSGAPISMQGMTDTVLNLGLNDETTEGLAALTDNPAFAYDSYRRFIQMFGDMVLGIPKSRFDELLAQMKDAEPKDIIAAYKALIMEVTGRRLPQDPKEQLLEAVQAVFRYHCDIADDQGTSVIVQRMVFGNMGETSGSGTAFSRNPLDGQKKLSGEFLINAQGEDITAGIRTPLQIAEMENRFPDAYRDFQRIADVLEKHYKDMQEMEFTIENNKLYMLQTKTASRTAECAVRTAVDMAGEGLISKAAAVDRIDVEQIAQMIHSSHNSGAEELTAETDFSQSFNQIMTWADEIRTLKVRANANHPADALLARRLGAQGIGLCRTEHMFFQEERECLLRQVMTAATEAERRGALEKLLPYHKSDFREIYEVMEDLPVTIRLMDPPVHGAQGRTGQRGCRLAITYPEIAEMQARAIIEAAIEVSREKNIEIVPEIMIPLVGIDAELAEIKKTVEGVIEACRDAYETEIDYFIGTMIEVPRAALTAGEIAKEADFFSFGTNDLTQTVFGLLKEDAAETIDAYIEKGILAENPFQTIDQSGVGQLMELAVKQGRQTRPNLKLGICGDHGGDPKSIAFCHRIGLHHVSCAPYSVPVARIAAAQAAIRNGQ